MNEHLGNGTVAYQTSLFQGLAQQDLERTVITACAADTGPALLLQDMHKDDWTDGAARDGYVALAQMMRAGHGVNLVLLAKHLMDAGTDQQMSCQALLAHVGTHHSDTHPLGHIRAMIGHLKTECVRRRLDLALRQALYEVRDASCDLQQMHRRVPGLVSVALSRAVPNEATIERDNMLALADKMIDRQALGDARVLKTGQGPIDRAIKGGRPGEVIVLAGASSMGKSALGLQIGRTWALQGDVFWWSGEMSKDELALRATIQDLQMTEERLEQHPSQILRAADLEARGFYVDDQPADVDQLIQRIRLFHLVHPKMRAAGIDHIGLLGDADYKVISAASRKIKALALELGITILLLCQLNMTKIASRQDKRPEMGDLRESGQIAQDADKILMVYRSHYYGSGDPQAAEVYVRKFRNGENNLAIRLRWTGHTMTFSAPVPQLGGRELRLPLDDDPEPSIFSDPDSITMEDVPL